jgi:hypothetical protein
MSISSLLDSASLSSATRERLETFTGNPRQLIDELVSAGAHRDTLTVIARVLPQQFALAWACECIRNLLVRDAPAYEVDRAGLALGERWLQDPSEDNRRSALDFAEYGNFKGVGGWLAAAVGWTGGSIAPVGYTPVPPGKYLAADAVAIALVGLASQRPDELAEREAFCVTAARDRFGCLTHSEALPPVQAAQQTTAGQFGGPQS